MLHKEKYRSVPQPTIIKARQEMISFAAISNILSATIVKAPKLRLISPTNLLKALPVYESSVHVQQSSDFHQTTVSKNEEKHVTHLYPDLPLQILVDHSAKNKQASVDFDKPETGLLSWQKSFMNHVEALRNRPGSSKNSVSESDFNALAQIPRIIEHVLTDQHEIHQESKTTMGPGLMMVINTVITAATYGSGLFAGVGAAVQEATSSAFLAGLAQGVSTATFTSFTGNVIRFGDLAEALETTFDKDGLTHIAIEGLTQGILKKLENHFYSQDSSFQGNSSSFSASSSNVSLPQVKLPEVGWTTDFLGHKALENGIRSAMTGIVRGESWEDSLKTFTTGTTVDYLGANLSKEIGDLTTEVLTESEALSRGLEVNKLRQVGTSYTGEAIYSNVSAMNWSLNKALHLGKGALLGLILKGDPLVTGLAAAGAEGMAELCESLDIIDPSDENFFVQLDLVADLTSLGIGTALGANETTRKAAQTVASQTVQYNNGLHIGNLFLQKLIFDEEDEIEALEKEKAKATTKEERLSCDKKIEKHRRKAQGYQAGLEGERLGQKVAASLSAEIVSFLTPGAGKAVQSAGKKLMTSLARKAVTREAGKKSIQKGVEKGAQKASQEGVEITLKYKPGMDKRDFNRKARALQDLAKRGKLRKSNMTSRSNVTEQYRKSLRTRAKKRWGKSDPERLKRFEKKLEKMDVDHVQELQVGGRDIRSNLRMLDSSVNRSIGPQIRHQLKNIPAGTRITGVRIK